MIASRFFRLSFFASLLFVATGACAQPQQAQKGFEPHVGQEGKDVVWVPTSQALVDKMLDLAKVTPKDFLMDLGSGDGRTVITAAKRGARAVGIEYNPDMVELSKRNAEKAGVADKVKFMKADLFETDLSQATVITMFLLNTINLKLRPKLLDLKPGTRIVSNTFTMDDWQADETATAGDSDYYNTALLWIVPAKVEGNWKLAQGELALKQRFQMIEGTFKSGGNSIAIAKGRLRGDQIQFSTGGSDYSGRVEGNTMVGTVKTGGNTASFSATLAKP